MTIKDLINKDIFTLVHEGDNTDQEISKPFCCDLLSIAMSKAPEGAAWVTVMANMNTLAVASLTECACIVLAEGTRFDDPSLQKAKMEGITVFATDKPVFESAQSIVE